MSLIIFLVILGIMVTVHEFGHFLAARLSGVRVEIFSIGFGRPVYKKVFDGCEFRICLIPLGGYVKLFGDEPSEFKGQKDAFLGQPKSKRAFIIGLGPVFNYLLAWVVFCLVFIVGIELPSTKIGVLLDDQAAARAGILEGDKVLAVNGEDVDTWSELVAAIQANESSVLNMKVQRDGAAYDFQLTPDTKQRKDIFGRERKVSFAGIGPSDEMKRLQYPVFKSISEGTKSLFVFTGLTLKGLWLMITGAMPVKESVTGPLGIYFVTKEAAKIGLGAVLHLMAVISMSLGIFNLLPLPVLDGGHLFFIVIEALRRRPLSDKIQERVNQFGFAFMMLLMVLVVANDIQRYFFK